MRAIWEETAERPQFASLRRDIRTEVLIIGGGIAGLLCAYMLRRAGVDCVLVEAERICGGVTGNTTAKITLQHGLLYDTMLRRFGCETARLYLLAQREAIEEYREICRTVSCEFEERPSYVYSRRDRGKIEREAAALRQLGYSATVETSIELPFPIAGAVRVDGQAEFHPLRFAFAIAKDLPIYEKTKVLEWRPDGVITDGGRILADKTIVATHFPLFNKHGAYFLKMYQHRSYVLALENAQELDGMYVDEDDKGLSFRKYNGLLLLGGGSHRTGKRGGNWQELEAFAKAHYPQAKAVARWATQDCMTLDGIPYIGQYSPRTPNLFVTTGFQKWGMTSAMAAAGILADLVCGKKNVYAQVFSPSRSMLHPQLAVNAGETMLSLLTPTVPRCPHMGCALHYNAKEHSWDCPCHGSRFSESGKLLDNPATDDKK